MGSKLPVFLILSALLCVYGNVDYLEGPFLFFGPNSLAKYKRPALEYVTQDELLKIYGEQPVIVVFNNKDSLPLSSGCFPRLMKMLEGKPYLSLPQESLDVHPDYISNETQMLILEGPWSERDAQMTETFARLEDIYGEGKVLGILGNSISTSREWLRRRRRGLDSLTTEVPEKTAKTGDGFALYNATGPPGRGALFYSSSYPELTWPDGTKTLLSTPIGEQTVKPTRLYTNLVVRFADGENTRDKITLEFSFKQASGWWQAVGVEVKRGLESTGLYLQAPAPPDAPAAVLGKSYQCRLPLVYSSEEASLKLRDVQMQPFMDNTEKFEDSFDCVGYFTVPIWSGLMISFLLLIGLIWSSLMILDIKTMDKFENRLGKQLVVTVFE